MAIQQDEAGHRLGPRESGWQRPGHPDGEHEERHIGREQQEPQPRSCQPDGELHRDPAVTMKVLPPVRPFTAGLYISSACAGGTTNVPAVVARARYVAE